MTTAASETGQAPNEEFVTIFSREIFNNGRDDFMAKVLLVKGQPQINIQKNYFNFKFRKWLPGKGSLFFKQDAWQCFSTMINPLIQEIDKMGIFHIPSIFLSFFQFKDLERLVQYIT